MPKPTFIRAYDGTWINLHRISTLYISLIEGSTHCQIRAFIDTDSYIVEYCETVEVAQRKLDEFMGLVPPKPPEEQ